MSKKSNRKKKGRENLLAKTGKGSASVALLVTVIAIAAVFVYLSDSDGTGASTPSRSGDSAAETASVVSAEALPVFHDNPEAAKPFPALMPPSRYEHPVVSRAYEIAHEIPDVLAQQPCYCYCKNFGSREPSRLLGL